MLMGRKINYFLQISFALVAIFAVTSAFTIDQYMLCIKSLNDKIDNSNTYVLIPPAAPTVATLNVVINSLTGISDDEQTMTLTFMMQITWFNNWLKNTDPMCLQNNDYKYVIEKTVFLDWFPHVILANNRDVMVEESWTKFPAVIYANGTVVWQATIQAVFECILDVYLFPVDYQECKIEIASPQYNKAVLQFVVPDINRGVQLAVTESGKSGVWQLIGQTYEPLNEAHPGISFKLLLQRRPTFYIIAIVLPLLAIDIMTVITFVLPGDQHEKMSTSQMPVLAYFIINVFIYDYMPASDAQPFLNIFLVIKMFLAAAASGFTAFLFKMRNREKEMKKVGNEEELRARFKILAICNTTSVNTLSLIGYCSCCLALWVAAALYLGIGAITQRGNMSTNYLPLLVTTDSIARDKQE